MGVSTPHAPVVPVLVAFSRHATSLDWAREQATKHWGPIAESSPTFDFSETDYYGESMGSDLRLQLWAFEQMMPPESLVERKLQTNDWEAAYAQLGAHPESRPLNLDPGYVTPAKFVLASTKDHAHRIYLAQGIFAEVTLYYSAGRWQAREWTYPNYRREDYQQFLTACRKRLRRLQRERSSS